MIYEYLKSNNIIITDNLHKQKILKYITKNKLICNIKIYTVNEIIDNLIYTYKDDTLYYISTICNINLSLLNKYLKYMIYINESNNIKVNEILKYKEKLLEEGYLIKNEIFIKYLNDKNIILYNLDYLSKEKKNIIDILNKNNNITIINDEYSKINNLVFKNTLEEEILFVANSIMKNNLKNKIILLNNSYENPLKRIFNLYNIPFEIIKNNPIINYSMSKYLLELLDKEEDVFKLSELLKERYNLKDEFLNNLYNKITRILSKYQGKKNIKNIINYELKNTYITKQNYKNAVSIYFDYKSFDEDDNIYIMGCSLPNFPTIKKDTDYLTDKEKESLNISTSLDNVREEKIKIKQYLNIYNVTLTYCKFSSTEEFAYSSFIDELKLVNVEDENKYISEDYTKYLLCKNLDEYTKFGSVSKELIKLGRINSNYKKYDNTYNGINKKEFNKYINNNLHLSYTTLDTFFKCPFRYYLGNIINLKEERENTINIIFGNIVHNILKRIYHEENIDKIINEEINNNLEDKTLTTKDLFYINKYNTEIKKMITILKNQVSDFKEEHLEEKFSFNKKIDDINITIKGFIDKVITYSDDNNKYFAVIDYKTGTVNPNINNIIYGLNMQLFFYNLLINKTKPNYTFAGAYLQNVLKDVLPYKENKTYNDLLIDSYKLDGYTLKNNYVVSKLDKKLEFLKTISFKLDGEFSSFSRVLTEKQINKLNEIVESNLDKAINEIINVNFKINPKKIGFDSDIEGCKFCKYKDICFRKNEDVQYLKQYKNLEFLGDEDE